jgi:predicted component of type VI protein secretion system
MPAIYHSAQKSKYRITLEIEALEDFNPHQINWEELFELQGNERCEAYIEDLSNPLRW